MSFKGVKTASRCNAKAIIREALLKAVAQMRLAETVAANRDAALAAQLLELSEATQALISTIHEGRTNG